MKKIKNFPKGLGYYFVDFFISIIIGLGIVILVNIPMKFIRTINMDLGAFIVHFLGMCICLYIRSYRRGYHTNTKTYTFGLKKATLLVGILFVIQITLILIIRGHAVYITGPTVWLTSYILPAADRTMSEGKSMIAGYDWLFMLLFDTLIYAPIMIFGEYRGAKQNKAEN